MEYRGFFPGDGYRVLSGYAGGDFGSNTGDARDDGRRVSGILTAKDCFASLGRDKRKFEGDTGSGFSRRECNGC